MLLKKWLLRVGMGIGVVLLLALLAVGAGWWYLHPKHERTDGIVYGTRHGKNLTLDVLKPGHPNGLAVAVMVSGSWKSSGSGSLPSALVAPLLRRGYTVFAICHVSQPESTVMEIAEDVKRGIRFIKMNAQTYGIDPQRIGVTGGSSGGHLSLVLATLPDSGDPEASDPMERESSTVRAVAVFFPVTDLLNLGASTENPGDGGPPKSFVKAFGPDAKDLTKWKVIGRSISPIYHVNSNLPPVLIYHGDQDTLVPLDQSTRFQDVAEEVGKTVTIVVRRGGKHGWPTMIGDIRAFANWFDKHLIANQPKPGA